jgi:hypothetical protein
MVMYSHRISSVEEAYHRAYPEAVKFAEHFDAIPHIHLISKTGQLVVKFKYAATIVHPVTIKYRGRFYSVGKDSILNDGDQYYFESEPKEAYMELEE